jgi:serine/threonine-protein kinase HipA
VTVRALCVWLHGRRVATLRAPKVGQVTCQYETAVLDEYPLNTPVLSCSVPVRTGRRDAWAFTTGLLPEGQHRQAMAARAGVTTLDLLGMLDRFGRDVAGAVVVSGDDPPLRDAGIEPFDSDSLADAVRDLDDHPLGLYDDSELSIAGLQDKMLLVADGDGWARPTHGYPSTHILKVDDRVHRGLVRAEHACLTLAREAGLPAAHSRLMTVEDAECIIVSRFDRRTDLDGSVHRVHQEDACQALGIDPSAHQGKAKYEAFGGPSFAGIARLLDAWSLDGPAQLDALLGALAFTVAIGNADAHGKNLALLHPTPGQVELAPLYDTVPTVLWPRLRSRAAMTVAGQDDLRRISLDDIAAEAKRWALDQVRARALAVDVSERLLAVLEAGKVDVDTRALAVTETRLKKLLRVRG